MSIGSVFREMFRSLKPSGSFGKGGKTKTASDAQQKIDAQSLSPTGQPNLTQRKVTHEKKDYNLFRSTVNFLGAGLEVVESILRRIASWFSTGTPPVSRTEEAKEKRAKKEEEASRPPITKPLPPLPQQAPKTQEGDTHIHLHSGEPSDPKGSNKLSRGLSMQSIPSFRGAGAVDPNDPENKKKAAADSADETRPLSDADIQAAMEAGDAPSAQAQKLLDDSLRGLEDVLRQLENNGDLSPEAAGGQVAKLSETIQGVAQQAQTLLANIAMSAAQKAQIQEALTDMAQIAGAVVQQVEAQQASVTGEAQKSGVASAQIAKGSAIPTAQQAGVDEATHESYKKVVGELKGKQAPIAKAQTPVVSNGEAHKKLKEEAKKFASALSALNTISKMEAPSQDKKTPFNS